MIQLKRFITNPFILSAVIVMMLASSCKKDDQPAPIPRSFGYTLLQADVLGVSGTATFTETSSTVTTLKIVLTGTSVGNHPAEIRMNSAIEGGAVVVTLMPVDENGISETEITTLTYNQVLAFDGYIQVSKSSSQPNEILALGDIGGNLLTTTRKTFTLNQIGSFGVLGTALFEKRVNGNTLVSISVTGAISGVMYPATINLGSIQTVGGGPVVKTLNDIDGTNGKSTTNVRTLDTGLSITYDNWMVYDGYMNIYQTSVSLNNIICHGNIGSN